MVIFRFLLLLSYLVGLTYALFSNVSSFPNISREILNIPTDKFVHFCMFLPFPVLCHFAFGKKHNKRWKAFLWFFFILLLGLSLSALSEIGQSYTEYRTADPADFVADSLASLIGALIVFIIDLW